jgi:hypothetical protein
MGQTYLFRSRREELKSIERPLRLRNLLNQLHPEKRRDQRADNVD